jgi:hypothetical protein
VEIDDPPHRCLAALAEDPDDVLVTQHVGGSEEDGRVQTDSEILLEGADTVGEEVERRRA